MCIIDKKVFSGSRIIFDTERMRYPFTGLYYYCLYLSKALIGQQRLHELNLKLYVPGNAYNIFDSSTYLKQHSLHKYRMPRTAADDIWHCTFQGSNYFPTQKNISIILTIHDINFLYEKVDSNKRKRFQKSLQSKISKADKIITISEYVKKDVLNNFIIKDEKIEVIYNGCNTSEASIDDPPERPLQAPFIFTIGTILEKKNFHVLAPLLVGNDFILIISGIVSDKNYMEKILSDAKKFNVRNRIIFTGPVSEAQKKWYFKNCLLFAFPSIAEGFGLPVLEAMSFGKPVLLSHYTSLKEIGGKHAFYFENFEPGHMQKKMQLCLEHYYNSDDKDNLINWSKKFSWEKSAEQHWHLYESIVQ